MKSYRKVERMLAKSLDTFPLLRGITKGIYQRFNYLLFGERGFQAALHPQVRIMTPERWASVAGQEKCAIFFGYYDKSPWSSDIQKAVFHCLKGDVVEIRVYDREEQNVSTLEHSSTWNYQQGSMLQWLPASQGQKIIFNTEVDGNLVARVVSVVTEQTGLIPWPIQVLHPDGQTALTLNYKRLNRIRPEYGYAIAVRNFSADQPLDQDGIWRVNLQSGNAALIISLETLSRHQPRFGMNGAVHKVNHLMYSPQGQRFVFVHRWIGSNGKFSRLYIANANGSNLKLLLDHRLVSHYAWRDEEHLLVWARTEKAGDHYYLLNVLTGQWKIVGQGVLDIYGDGHPSFSPDRRWIITDTYPDRARQQHLLLYEVATNRVIELGRFLAPLEFSGPSRCDLHPRWSPDGKMISIDSAHTGYRMSYMLDVSSIVGG